MQNARTGHCVESFHEEPIREKNVIFKKVASWYPGIPVRGSASSLFSRFAGSHPFTGSPIRFASVFPVPGSRFRSGSEPCCNAVQGYAWMAALELEALGLGLGSLAAALRWEFASPIKNWSQKSLPGRPLRSMGLERLSKIGIPPPAPQGRFFLKSFQKSPFPGREAPWGRRRRRL